MLPSPGQVGRVGAVARITDWPMGERPGERLCAKGAEALADEPRALEVKVVLDPDLRIEHPQQAWEGKHQQEPSGDSLRSPGFCR